jgi:tetratricopeptide (TPR) repeat protein
MRPVAERRGRGRSDVAAASLRSVLWPARIILFVALAWLYLPTLSFAPISLDDAGHLAVAAEQDLSQIWQPDRYGHLRPIKSALFWLWSREQTDWGAVRAAVLAVLLLCTVLVERLAARVSGAPMQALLVAACWALHPVTPAAVCWLSAMHVVLCLVGLLAYLECAERSIGGTPSHRLRWLTMALVCLAFALMSHQLAVLGPLLLWLRRQPSSAASTTGSPAIAYASSAALVALWLTLIALISNPAASYRYAGQPAWLLSVSAARYVGQHALWWLAPADRFGVLLSDRPEAHLIASALAWPALIILCIGCWRIRRREPVLFFGVAWFLITLAPFANFVPIGNTPLAMHYLAVPSVGLTIALVRALAMLIERLASARPATARLLPWALGAALAVYWLPATTRAVSAFGDEEQLFSQTALNYPDQIEPLVNLASTQLQRSDFAAAASTLERARRLEPENIGVVHNQFSLLWRTGKIEAAVALLDGAPRVASRPEFQLARGQALNRLRRYADAIDPLKTAYDSKSAEVSDEHRFGAGTQLLLALLQSGKRVEAERFYWRMRADYPANPELRAMEETWRE